MALQTEFQFVLPKVYVDSDGTLHREGVMRLATAKDEIAPLQDFRVQSNRAYLVIILLSRVITKLGTLAAITPATIEDLFSSDLAFLQEFYRKVNEEGTTSMKAVCPSCAHEFDVDIGTGMGEY